MSPNKMELIRDALASGRLEIELYGLYTVGILIRMPNPVLFFLPVYIFGEGSIRTNLKCVGSGGVF